MGSRVPIAPSGSASSWSPSCPDRNPPTIGTLDQRPAMSSCALGSQAGPLQPAVSPTAQATQYEALEAALSEFAVPLEEVRVDITCRLFRHILDQRKLQGERAQIGYAIWGMPQRSAPTISARRAVGSTIMARRRCEPGRHRVRGFAHRQGRREQTVLDGQSPQASRDNLNTVPPVDSMATHWLENSWR